MTKWLFVGNVGILPNWFLKQILVYTSNVILSIKPFALAADETKNINDDAEFMVFVDVIYKRQQQATV